MKDRYMLKKLLFIILPIITSSYISCNAQDWAPIGAKWYFTQHYNMSSAVSYNKIEVEKDTVVQGKNCKKLMGSFDGCGWYSQILYKSNDSVYFYHTQKNEFALLYDFNASPGDIWEVYNITTNFGFGNPDTTKLIVDSIGQTSITGQNLRIIYTSIVNQLESSFHFGGTIIENIGAPSMFPGFNFCDPGPGPLRCYEDQFISYQTGPYFCDQVTLGVPEKEKKQITVFPNPSSQFIRIDLSEMISGDIEIINLAGQKVLYRTFEASSLKINTRKLAEGLYVLNIIDDDSIIHTEKLIIVR